MTQKSLNVYTYSTLTFPHCNVVFLLDMTDCPEGLTYAPQNGSCIAFTVTVQSIDGLVQNDELLTCLETNINTEINNGQLYNLIEGVWGNDTKFTGIGKPGAGVDYIVRDTEITEDDDEENIPTEKDDDSAIPEATSSPEGNITAGYLALIILALFAVPLIVFAVVRYRRRQEEEMARVREFAGEPADDTELDLENPTTGHAAGASSVAAIAPSLIVPAVSPRRSIDDDDSSAPSVWSDTRSSQIDIVEDESAHVVNAKLGSSLAAMGMASSVARNLYEKKHASSSDEEAEEESSNVETTKMAVVPPLSQQEESLDLVSIKAEIQSPVEKHRVKRRRSY